MTSRPAVVSKDMSSLGNVASACTLVLAALLALNAWLSPNRYHPWPAFHGELAMACAGLLLTLWVLSRAPGAARLQLPWPCIIALSVAAVPWVQCALGLVYFAGDAWLGSLYAVGFSLAALVGHQLVRLDGPVRPLETLAGMILLASLISMWIALCQWLGLDYFSWAGLQLPTGSRYYANFAQPNHFALMLSLGIVCAGLLYVRGRIGGACAALLIGFFGLGIAMSSSRAVVLQLGFVATWLFFARSRLPESERARLGLLHMATAVLLILLTTMLWPHLRDAVTPIESGNAAADHLTPFRVGGMRTTHWITMLDAAIQQPWWGYGWNQTPTAQLAVAATHPASHELLGQSHNQLLDFVVWLGIPLGLLLTFAVLWWFAQAARKVRDAPGVFAVAFVGAAFAHSIVEFPLYYTYFMLPIALVMGGMSATHEQGFTASISRRTAYAMVVAAGAVTALIAIDYMKLEDRWQAIRFDEARIGTTRVGSEPPDVRLLTHMKEFLRLLKRDPLAPVTDQELLWLEQVAHRYPNAFFLSTYAAALVEHDQPDRARQMLTPICKTHNARACAGVKKRWAELAKTQPKLASIAWPE